MALSPSQEGTEEPRGVKSGSTAVGEDDADAAAAAAAPLLPKSLFAMSPRGLNESAVVVAGAVTTAAVSVIRASILVVTLRITLPDARYS